MKSRISVVIPVYNGAHVIAEQLRALDRQENMPEFEVIISDNGSTDNLREVISAISTSYDVRIVDSSMKQGICTARNVGVQYACGELIIFCDADDYVDPGFVAGHWEAYQKYPRSIIAGSLVYSAVNSPEQLEAYGINPAKEPDNLGYKTREDLHPYSGYLPSVAGCNFSVPTDIYLEVGGMDSSYIGGSEETDFTWRVLNAGYDIVSTSKPRVNYALRSTARSIYKQQLKYQLNKVLLWERFKDRGMTGPSVKYSLLSVLRSLPALLQQKTRKKAAYTLGGNVGALQGIWTYRILKKIPERELM